MKSKFYAALLSITGILFFGASGIIAQTCPGLATLTLNVSPAPQPALNYSALICTGSSTNIAVTATFASYSWNTGANGQSISVNAPGTYTVTVSNAVGCTGTVSATVANAPTPAPNITQNTYACNGTVTLNAGSGFNTYSWSNGGGSTQTANFTTAGTYFVTVTNTQGCTGTDDFTVSIPPPPNVVINSAATFCSDQSLSLNATSGFTSYSWTGGGTGPSLNVTTAGTYTVTATDAFGCTDTDTKTVTSLPAPAPLVPVASVCPNSTVTLTISNPPFDIYNWNTGSNGISTTVSIPGPYTVTVTAPNGCTGSTTVNVTPLPAPSVNISQLTYTCNGQISLDAGSGFSSYSWSTSAGTPGITVNTAGNYTVTVTNVQGCTGTDDFQVSIPTPPNVNISGNATFCASASLSLNATPGFTSYAWTGGSSGPSLTVSTAGTYTVTATDAFGCTDTDTKTVSSLPNPTPIVPGASLCPGASVSLTVSNAPFNAYNWSDGTTNSSTTASGPGQFTVTVTAANGCTGSVTAVVSPLPAPNVAINQLTYACNGQISMDAGAGFSSYLWNTNANTPGITVTTSGNYTVTVTNTQGCTGTDSYAASIPNPPLVTISGNNSVCLGSLSTLTASSGLVSYSWSNGQNGQSINVGTAGNFTVTATDGFGCTDTDIFNLSVLPAPSPTINGLASICSGTNTTFSVSAPFTSYAWSTTETTPSISVGSAGTYTVTVTAANGCTGTDTQALGLIPAPAPNITQAPYQCNDQLVLNAGTGFNSYNWSGGGNTATITVTTSGDYTVTVTNAQGCTGTDIQTASIPAQPAVTISGASQLCSGASTTLSATAGLSSYVWSNSQFTQNITVNASGNFTVTATDAFGCTATDEFSIVGITNPVAIITGPSSICGGSSATFSLNGSFSAYAWSTGENTPSIVVNTPDDYTVTVTAANGCTGTDVQSLIISNTLSPQVVEQPYACNGQFTLDAGAGFTNYTWSGGQASQTITVNAPGDYSVTVADGSGCTGSAVTTVYIPAPPAVSISGQSLICQGASTNLNATAGLTAYIWSNSQVGPTINVGLAGNYTVTATDAFGCTTTAQFTLNTNAAPTPQISGPAIICTNSSGTLSATAGLASYSWSTTESTPNITVSNGGTYTVTVTNSAGCSATTSTTVSTATSLSPTVLALPYNCNGQITLDAGAGFNAYAWSGGGSNQSQTVSVSGNYTVTVTDVTGCTGANTLSVTVPTLSSVSISGNNSFCTGLSTTLNASAGLSNYLWSNGGNQASVQVSVPDIYTVTATDANGCTVTATQTVTALPLPQAQISGPAALCAGASGTLGLSQSFTGYNWSDSSTGASLNVSAAGTYSVTVTDANGCTATDDLVLQVNANPTPAASALPYNCDGQITLSASLGYNAYTWTGSSNAQTLNVNQSGTYTVTVTDSNGCTGTAAQTVTVPTLSSVSIAAPQNFCPGGNATLSATSGFVSYNWSTNETTNAINTGTAGNFTVTATDALGCSVSQTVNVGLFPAPVATISGPTSVCPGNTANLGVSGTFASYIWSNGSATSGISVTPPLSATVTVTDNNGCSASATTTVIVSNQLNPNVVQQPYNCNGKITLDAGSGFPIYTWNTGGSSAQTISVSQSGSYTVTVSDGNGCSGTASIQVTVPAQASVSVSGDAILCPAEVSTLTANAGFVNYVWTGGNNGPTLTVNAAGNYTVTATDNLGCTSTATQAVQSVPNPVPAITGPMTICGNNPVQLNVTGSFSSINWAGGTTGAILSVSQPGTYTVTVTNASGCIGTASTTLNVGAPLQPAISIQPYQCNGQITLQADAGFATYNWNNASGNASLTVSQAGNYTVTVTNANGCTGTAEKAVTIPTPPQVTINGNAVICAGKSTTLSATAGFQAYKWSNGQTTASITTNQTIPYTVTVTDANNCTATALFTVNLAPPLTPQFTGNGNICPGASTVVGATQPFATYNWSNGPTTPTVTLTQAGNYTLSVSDAAGCTGVASFDINLNPAPSTSIVVQPVDCKGSMTLNAGTGFSAYKWNSGPTTSGITVTQAGAYTVTITNTLTCTGTATALVALAVSDTVRVEKTSCNPAQLGTTVNSFNKANGCDSVVITRTLAAAPATATATVTSDYNGFSVACAGSSNGKAQVTPNAGSAPFSYNWSNGATTATVQNLSAGNYVVTFTDAAGCSGTATVSLNQPPPIAPQIDATNPTCEATGEINIQTISGGKGPYNIKLALNTINTNGTVPVLFDELVSGPYNVEITDANGCTTTESVVLPPAPAVSEFVTDTFNINKGDTIQLNAAAGITIQPLQINWQSLNPLSCTNCLAPFVAPLSSTEVTLTVKGYTGCAAEARFLIQVKSVNNVFVPNVIKPGSANNDGFTIFGDEQLVKIRDLQIFDRWGSLITRVQNIVPNDPKLGWDGRWNGKEVATGVFVYWAEVEFKDGTTKIYKGDVTVLR
ncbi:MAG: gliding motility-associated C-terminal domain-containing protein [Bacteroidota bacterium]